MYLDAEFHKKHFCLSGTKALTQAGPVRAQNIRASPYSVLHPIRGRGRTFFPGRII